MFISDALAADGASQAGGDMSMIIVLTVCMLAVYFFVMRPNSKKRKEMQKLLDNLSVGDEVLTNGGIAGRIVKLPDNKEYVLVLVCDGVVMQMKRNYVVAVLPKGTLADVADSKASDAPAAKEGKGRKKKSKKAQKSEVLEDKSKDEAEIKDEAAQVQESSEQYASEVKEEAPAEAPVAEEAPQQSVQEEAPAQTEELADTQQNASSQEDKPKA